MDRAEEGGESLARLNHVVPAAYTKYCQLVTAMQLMVHFRIETLALLNRVADDLDARHRKVNVAKAAGAATSAAGSAAVLAGGVLLPLTSGASFPLIAMGAGATMVGAGGLALAGSHLAEKVLEEMGLNKLQQALDRDNQQCQRVHQLWKELDGYSVDIVSTIALADPTEGSSIRSWKTLVEKAMETVVDPATLIVQVCSQWYLKARNFLGSPTCQDLFKTLKKVADYVELDTEEALSRARELAMVILITIACVALPATIFVGSIFLLVKTAIDIHNGSLSKVAQDLRKKGEELHKGLDTWLQQHII